MRKGDLLVIAVTAFVTTVAAVSLWEATPKAIAAEQTTKETLKAPPALEIGSVRLTLDLDRTAHKAGETPVVTLTAVNTRDRASKLKVVVGMTTVQPASPMARMMPRPTQVWSHSCKVKLKPRQTRTFELPTGVALKAGNVVAFSLRAGRESITAARFSVPPSDPSPSTTPAKARPL